MSPDDIFAAQFWPWPDPAIKRDGAGRVLFVNAAFLQLYGGTVDAWQGNVIGGWPAPQAPHAGQTQPYRFETRLPATALMAEQVYDWMELTGTDGNAFALARNVTTFTQAPEPDPGHAMPAPPVEQSFAAAPPPQTQEQADTPTQYFAEAETAPTVSVDPAGAERRDGSDRRQEASLAAEAPHAEQAFEPIFESAPTEVQTAAPQAVTAPAIETTPEIAQVPDPAPTPVQDEVYQPEPAPIAAPERETERRALPIENEDAVLGNNWRDAVIAKAVGTQPVPAEPKPEQTPAALAAQNTAGQGGPIRILLAEDNAINALLTRTLLEAEGHSVDTVEDGLLAVEAMKTAQYDLIFMDMRMPNMDGLESTRKIRTLPNVSRDLPIIALTANAFDDDRNACFDSGMNDFMTKPVSAEELSDMVKNWTGAREEKMAS